MYSSDFMTIIRDLDGIKNVRTGSRSSRMLVNCNDEGHAVRGS